MSFQPGHVLQSTFRLVRADVSGMRFEAEDLRTRRPVTVTILPSDVLAPATFEPFVRECQRLAQLNHPNVMRLRSLGRELGTAYLVTDPLAGRTLRAYLQSRGWRLGDVEWMPIARQLAAALTALHAQKLVHRELRPECVLLGPQGQVTLTDFGIARRHQHGVLSGVPGYMAPEQIPGREDAGAKSDQYAFAVLCFEALTGRAPFSGRTRDELLRAHLLAPRPFASGIDPSVSQAISSVLHRALSVDPAARFDDVGQFFAALEAAVNAGDAEEEELVSGATDPALNVARISPALMQGLPGKPNRQNPAEVQVPDTDRARTAVERPAKKVVVRVGSTANELLQEEPPMALGDEPVDPVTDLYGIPAAPLVEEKPLEETLVRPLPADVFPAASPATEELDTSSVFGGADLPEDITSRIKLEQLLKDEPAPKSESAEAATVLLDLEALRAEIFDPRK